MVLFRKDVHSSISTYLGTRTARYLIQIYLMPKQFDITHMHTCRGHIRIPITAYANVDS